MRMSPDPVVGVVEARRLVTALYQGFLHRLPGDDELDAWVGGLTAPNAENRVSAADAAESFLRSSEHQHLVAELEPKSDPRLFVPPGHFYSPVVEVDTVREHMASTWADLPESLPGLAINRASVVAGWNALLPDLQMCPFTAGPDPRFRYHFENTAYSYGDGSTLFAMIRRYRPKRITEIGCGWSSACMLDTIERELDGKCDVTFIEPYPQLVRDLMTAKPFPHRLLPMPVQQVPLDEFTRLERGDILFIDSTHVMKTGSDVTFEFLEILPRLADGVIVHIHDIFWPFEYSKEWVLQENRSWNEIYALRALLQGNPEWEVIFFGNYMTSLERGRVAKDFPTMLRNPGGAIWLRKRSVGSPAVS